MDIDDKDQNEANVHNDTATAIKKATGLLALFAFLSVVIIAGTDWITRDKIAENERLELLHQLSEVVPAMTRSDIDADALLRNKILIKNFPPYNNQATLYLHHTNNISHAIFEITTPKGYSGNIRLLIGINLQNQSITGARVLKHRETPGLGDKIEIRKSNWIKRFNTLSLQQPQPSGWRVKKDGGEFDQFTGATITPRATVDAIRQTLLFVQKKLRNQPEFFKLPMTQMKGKQQ